MYNKFVSYFFILLFSIVVYINTYGSEDSPSRVKSLKQLAVEAVVRARKDRALTVPHYSMYQLRQRRLAHLGFLTALPLKVTFSMPVEIRDLLTKRRKEVQRCLETLCAGEQVRCLSLWRCLRDGADLADGLRKKINQSNFLPESIPKSQANPRIVSILRMLLERGIDPDVGAEHGGTALYRAAELNLPEFVSLLLEFGARRDIGKTVVDYVTREKVVENNRSSHVEGGESVWIGLHRVPLRQPRQVSRENKVTKQWQEKVIRSKTTPLEAAVRNRNIDVVKLLLVDASQKEVDTVLFEGAKNNNEELIELGLVHGGNPLCRRDIKIHGIFEQWPRIKSTTALELLLEKGNLKMVKRAFKVRGKKMAEGGCPFNQILTCAARRGDMELAEYVACCGGQLNSANVEIALFCKHFEIVKFFLEKGLNPDVVLEVAARNEQNDVVQHVFPMASQSGKNTFLTYAAENKDIQQVEFALDHGADIATCLIAEHLSIPLLERLAPDFLKKIISMLCGKDKEIEDMSLLRILLNRSVLVGDVELAELVLGCGADPNLGAPLVAASSLGHTAVVRSLLDHGADQSYKVDGKTARQVAGNDEVAELLATPLEKFSTLSHRKPKGFADLLDDPLGSNPSILLACARNSGRAEQNLALNDTLD